MRNSLPIAFAISIAGVFLWHAIHTNPAERRATFKRPSETEWVKRTFPYYRMDPDAPAEMIREAKEFRNRPDIMAADYGAWEFAGPDNVGGRIVDIEFHPVQPEIVYAAAATGGVFRSRDAGLNWIPIFDDQVALSIGDIGLHPTDPDVIYVGTGEGNGGHNNFPGGGLYKSIDGGTTWKLMGLERTASIGRVVVDPTNPDRVYVAAVGSYFGPTPDRGLYRSDDAGTTWESSLFVSDSTGVVDLVVNPDDTDILYAATWERVRRPNSSHLYGPTSAIHRSTDGGDSWRELGPAQGLPDPDAMDIGRIGLAIHRDDPDILYALYNDGAEYLGLYRTDDGGDRWSDADPDRDIEEGTSSFSWYFGQVRVHPTDPDRVYAMDVAFMRSTNGGASWPIIYGYSGPEILHVDHHALAFDPTNFDRLLSGNDGGINISTDAGESWTKVASLPITQFYEIGLDAQQPDRIYGGTQDNGTLRTTTGHVDDWERIFGGDGFYVNVNHRTPETIYAESQFGALGKSVNDGDDWDYDVKSGISRREPTNWSTPVIMDPEDPEILYYGTDRVYQTTNGADRWNDISPDLSDGIPGTRLGTVTTIAVAPSNTDVIYAGTDDSHVWVTRDGGDSWTDISANLPTRWVTRVAVDPRQSEVAYAAFSGLKWLDPEPHIFRTTDGGDTWTDISDDLPAIPINALAIDHREPDAVFVGTDAGAYVSTTGGGSWSMLGTDMPLVSIYDFKVHPDERFLVAGTHGRSMYRLGLPEIDGPDAPREMAIATRDDSIDLDWRDNDETNLVGYAIYRDTASPATTLLATVGDTPSDYSDTDIDQGRTYYYRVRAITSPGGEGVWSWEVSGFSGDVGAPGDLPPPSSVTALGTARPNPFNPHTVLPFELRDDTWVKLAIYGSDGRRVRTLFDAHCAAGAHRVRWDGLDTHGRSVPSGVYSAVLEVDGTQHTQRLVLVK